LQPYKQEINRRKISSKGIFLSKNEFTPRPLAEVKYLPDNKYSFTGDITVYGNKIALYTFKGKLISVLIESAELAQTFREFYRLASTSKELMDKKGLQS
jgi:hypothetical protein